MNLNDPRPIPTMEGWSKEDKAQWVEQEGLLYEMKHKADALRFYLVVAVLLLVISAAASWGSDNEPNPYDEPEQCRGAMCP